MSNFPKAVSTYAGETISFGTMHGKHHQVAHAFRSVLGARVERVVGIDTDQFGTFSGEIGRTLSPVECARAKALLGIGVLGSLQDWPARQATDQ